MLGNQYSVFCNDFGKFRRLPVEGLFCKNESEGANVNLPFFVWYNTIIITILKILLFCAVTTAIAQEIQFENSLTSEAMDGINSNNQEINQESKVDYEQNSLYLEPLCCETMLGNENLKLKNDSSKKEDWNWMNFWQQMIATFVGFLLAIIASRIVYNINKKIEKEGVIYGIFKEFDYILEQFNNINIEKDLRFSPIETPFWHSVITGTSLSLINNHSWFKDIATVYARVDEINAWFKIKTEHYIEALVSEYDKINRMINKIEERLKLEGKEEDDKLFGLISIAKTKIPKSKKRG